VNSVPFVDLRIVQTWQPDKEDSSDPDEARAYSLLIDGKYHHSVGTFPLLDCRPFCSPTGKSFQDHRPILVLTSDWDF
jgi:hypothetical protein